MKQTPNRYQQSKPILLHSMQRIIVSYNNRKKHGAHPILNKTSEGCISSTGKVALFTEDLQAKGFLSLREMEETLGEYGDVEIDYVDHSVPDLPELSLLTKIVLRDLVQNGLLEHKVHDLIWHYATKYQDANVEDELKNLIEWLEKSEA